MKMGEVKEQLIHIRDNDELAAAAAEWGGASLLALDTEFVRETTFYPIAGLVQIGDGQRQYLLDPLTIDDWSPLRVLIADAKPKVLHAPSEDLELFQQLLGAMPAPLFDTQVGAALAGWGFGLGYQALVQQQLGIAVEKEQTRSNWLARPLSPEQCHYAALDVELLPLLFERIAERLTVLDRFDWWREEGDRVLAAAAEVVAPERYYRKLGGGWKLRGEQLAALRALCAWREIEARTRNVPRGRIVKDAELLEIARLLPRSNAELGRVLPPPKIRSEGAGLLRLVAVARDEPHESWPEPLPPPLPREWGGRLQALRDAVADRARALDLPPELLVRRRDCEELLRSGALPATLASGWRRAVIGDELLDLLGRLGRVSESADAAAGEERLP